MNCFKRCFPETWCHLNRHCILFDTHHPLSRTHTSYSHASLPSQNQPSCILIPFFLALRGPPFSACSLNAIDPQIGFFSWMSQVSGWLSGRIHALSQREADAIVRTEGISSSKLLPHPRDRLALDAPWSAVLTVFRCTSSMVLFHLT